MSKKALALIGIAAVLLLLAGVFCGAAAAADTSGLPMSGNLASTTYKLTDNVQLTGELFVPDGVTATIDLNGKTITAASGSRVITIQSGGNLTLEDTSSGGNGCITGGHVEAEGMVFSSGVYNEGTFIMNGGSIANNSTIAIGYESLEGHGYGGGVYNDGGTFIMNGGSITNNRVILGGDYCGNCLGGGVCNGGTFMMNGGTISGNSANIGGGVYNSKTFKVEGSAAVINNAGGNIENKFLSSFILNGNLTGWMVVDGADGTFSAANAALDGANHIINMTDSSNPTFGSINDDKSIGWNGTQPTGITTLTLNDGEAVLRSEWAFKGSTSFISPLPAKESLIFAGWYTAAEGGTQISNSDGTLVKNVTDYTDADGKWNSDSQTLTLYAQWKQGTVIALDGNGGTPSTPSVEQILDDTQSFNPPSANWAGHQLIGWFTNATDGTKVIDRDGNLVNSVETYTDADGKWIYNQPTLTLHAQWSESQTEITFYNGTTKIETKSVPYGGTLTLPAAPTGTTSFLGWRVGSTSGDFFSFYHGTNNILLPDSSYYDTAGIWKSDVPTLALYAAWDGAAPTPASYTVTATAGAGGSVSVAPTSPVTAGTTVTLTASANPGYHFKEWQKISGLPFSASKDNPLKFYMPNSNVSAEAVFEADSPSQTVIFLDANGGESDTTTVTATNGSSTLAEIKNPAKSGYIFNGFYTAKTNGTKVIGSDGTLQASTAYTDAGGKWTSDAKTLVLYAQWTPSGAGTHTVNVAQVSHGKAAANPTSAAEGTKITLYAMPDNNYNFAGWTATGVTPVPTGNPATFTMGTADVKITPLFTAVPTPEPLPPATYSISVATSGDGTASASAASAEAGESITLTASPDAGYSFKEWKVTSGGAIIDRITAETAHFTMPKASVSVTAVFKEAEPHSVFVDATGPGTVEASPGEGLPGTEITLTCEPSEGWTFVKWDVVPETVVIDENNRFIMPNEPVTVTAVLDIAREDVKPDDEGNAPINQQAVPFSDGEGVSVMSATNIGGDKLIYKAWDKSVDIDEVPERPGYEMTVISIIGIEATLKEEGKSSVLTADVTLSDPSMRNYVCLKHYKADETWEVVMPTVIGGEAIGDNTFRYEFSLSSYCPLAIVIEKPDATPVPHKSSSQGSSYWATPEPTATPTATPTPAPTQEAPTVKPVTTETPAAKSPAGVVGVLAGLGAAMVVFGLRRR